MNRADWIGTGAFLAVAGAGILFWLKDFRGISDPSHGAIAACEEATMEDLRAPSTYKLVWSNYTPRDAMPVAERKVMNEPDESVLDGERYVAAYVKKMEADTDRKLKAGEPLSEDEQQFLAIRRIGEQRAARNAPEDRTAFVTLEYDSENAFGSPVRSFDVCRLGAIGTDKRFERRDVLSHGPIPREEGQRTKDIATRLTE